MVTISIKHVELHKSVGGHIVYQFLHVFRDTILRCILSKSRNITALDSDESMLGKRLNDPLLILLQARGQRQSVR